MSDPKPHTESTATTKPLPQILDGIKVDFRTVRVIALTIIAVIFLLVTPVLYVLSKFVDYGKVMDSLHVTERLRPKILEGIPEELDTAYSRTLIIDAQSAPMLSSTDFMSFHATPDQKVVISIKVDGVGASPVQPVGLQVNGCAIPKKGPGYLEKPDIVLPAALQDCKNSGDEFDMNTVRLTITGGLQKGNRIAVECVILVYRQVWRSPRPPKNRQVVQESDK